jgi:hypothetical protein
MSSDELKKLDEVQSALEEAASKEPIPQIPLDKTHHLNFLTDPTNGVWYLSAKCEECRAIVPLFPDPFSGRSPQPFADAGGEFEATCPFCQARIGAKADEIFPNRWMG